jgi:hypothetical protein
MMQFDYIDNVPVMPVRVVAGIIGIAEPELTAELVAHTACGIWTGSEDPSVEFDDLWEFLEFRHPEAFKTIFG